MAAGTLQPSTPIGLKPPYLLGGINLAVPSIFDDRLAYLRGGVIELPSGLLGYIAEQLSNTLGHAPGVPRAYLAAVGNDPYRLALVRIARNARSIRLALEVATGQARTRPFTPPEFAAFMAGMGPGVGAQPGSPPDELYNMYSHAQLGETLSPIWALTEASSRPAFRNLCTAHEVLTPNSLAEDLSTLAHRVAAVLPLVVETRLRDLAKLLPSSQAKDGAISARAVNLERIASALALCYMQPVIAALALATRLLELNLFDDAATTLHAHERRERAVAGFEVLRTQGFDLFEVDAFLKKELAAVSCTHLSQATTLQRLPIGLFSELLSGTGMNPLHAAGVTWRDVGGGRLATHAGAPPALAALNHTEVVNPLRRALNTFGPADGRARLQGVFSSLLLQCETHLEMLHTDPIRIDFLSKEENVRLVGAALKPAADTIVVNPAIITASDTIQPSVTTGTESEHPIDGAVGLVEYPITPAFGGGTDTQRLLEFHRERFLNLSTAQIAAAFLHEGTDPLVVLLTKTEGVYGAMHAWQVDDGWFHLWPDGLFGLASGAVRTGTDETALATVATGSAHPGRMQSSIATLLALETAGGIGPGTHNASAQLARALWPIGFLVRIDAGFAAWAAGAAAPGAAAAPAPTVAVHGDLSPHTAMTAVQKDALLAAVRATIGSPIHPGARFMSHQGVTVVLPFLAQECELHGVPLQAMIANNILGGGGGPAGTPRVITLTADGTWNLVTYARIPIPAIIDDDLWTPPTHRSIETAPVATDGGGWVNNDGFVGLAEIDSRVTRSVSARCNLLRGHMAVIVTTPPGTGPVVFQRTELADLMLISDSTFMPGKSPVMLLGRPRAVAVPPEGDVIHVTHPALRSGLVIKA